jgi:hypothetical protein
MNIFIDKKLYIKRLLNDVVFTFTSGVATQTGSNDACSLRQITWSISEKNGVSAGMEMTRKYRIEIIYIH